MSLYFGASSSTTPLASAAPGSHYGRTSLSSMLLGQSQSPELNPIMPASSEVVWSVVSIGVLMVAVVLLVLLIRWASFHLGFQFSRLKHRGLSDR